MKLTKLRNIILKESALISRKKINPLEDPAYLYDQMKDIINFGHIKNSWVDQSIWKIPGILDMRDNGTTLYINTRLLEQNIKNIKTWYIYVDYKKLFLKHPVYGNSIKKLVIGRSDYKNNTHKLKSMDNDWNILGDIKDVTIEYDIEGDRDYHLELFETFTFGSGIKILNFFNYMEKKYRRDGNTIILKDPNNTVINKGIYISTNDFINNGLYDKISSIDPKFRDIVFTKDIKDYLKIPACLKVMLINNNMVKIFRPGVPYTLDIMGSSIGIKIDNGDINMENNMRKLYGEYYKNCEIYKLEPSDSIENGKKPKNYGYFLYFNKPII